MINQTTITIAAALIFLGLGGYLIQQFKSTSKELGETTCISDQLETGVEATKDAEKKGEEIKRDVKKYSHSDDLNFLARNGFLRNAQDR